MERVDVRALASLLYPEGDDSDDDNRTLPAGMTPADLGCSSSIKQVTGQVTGSATHTSNTDVTWGVEKEGEEPDPRPQPKYEVTYRQRVTASQVYLPVSFGGAEEDLMVRVELPGDLLTQVTLEVTSNTLTLASPAHHLYLPLPRPVDQRKGVATWDPTTHTLVVTLPTVHQPVLLPAASP